LVGGPAALPAATAATATVPIVATFAEDPVRAGLVTSLARPGGNLTGVNFLNAELAAKQLQLLRKLIPGAASVAVAVNPASPTSDSAVRAAEMAPRAMAPRVQSIRARARGELDTAGACVTPARRDSRLV